MHHDYGMVTTRRTFLGGVAALALSGIFDSGRTDVAYEDFNGHKLDRKMLELLRRH